MNEITECDGYKKLLAAVERDEREQPGFHDYRKTLAWVLERAQNYAESTGLEASNILDTWEKNRDYWYMNYYQESRQPRLNSKASRIVETVDEFKASVGDGGFRCPNCRGISKSPYECTSGIKVDKKVCDWKVYGLFGHMGLGIFVFVKDQARGQNIFMPVAWEKQPAQEVMP